MLVKVAEVLAPTVLILATTRPNELPTGTPQHHMHGKAALHQKVGVANQQNFLDRKGMTKQSKESYRLLTSGYLKVT